MKKISKQQAIDSKLFGPIYHGTTEDIRKKIDVDGFKIFKYGDSGKVNGYKYRTDHIHMPADHLGYGVYFTTVKSIAKEYNRGSSKLKEYYLDTKKILTINFGSSNTMMGWYMSMGYDPTKAKQSPTEWHNQTETMTENIKSKYDAVWYKGKGIRKLTDGDQVCVYNMDCIVEVDPSLTSGLEAGAVVTRKSDGMKGVALRVSDYGANDYIMERFKNKDLPEDSYHYRAITNSAKKVFTVKWKKGGTENNVLDIDLVTPTLTEGAHDIQQVQTYSSTTKHLEDIDVYVPVGSVSGTFYHGTSVDEDDELFDDFNPGVYGDYDAIWITDDRSAAEEFSSWKGFNKKYVLTVEYASDNMALIDRRVYSELLEYLGVQDLRESIDYLKSQGFDGWVTQGSIGRTIYNDIAVFNYDELKIEKVEPLMESVNDELNAILYEGVNFIHPYVSPRTRELSPEEHNIRNIAYAIKKPGAPEIKQAAADMARVVTANNILVPIPSSKGDSSANMELAKAIAELTGAQVVDALGLKAPRQSNRELGVAGKTRLKAKEMGFTLRQSINATNVLFVDNVAASGATIQAAQNLINGGDGLVYAKVES